MSQKEHFSSYFTGLFEAVGSISIRKNKYPIISMSFHIKNKALAEAITTEFNEVVKLLSLRERIGHGSIYKNRDKTLLYQITNKDGVFKFIEITSKYYRTPKINTVNSVIEYLNEYKKCNLSLIVIDTSTLGSNAWLSGYLEVNGCFSIATIYKSNSVNSFDRDQIHTYRQYYSMGFSLSHKKPENKENIYEPFLQSLADFLEALLHDDGQAYYSTCYLIRVNNINSIEILLDYLEEYPLYGTQYANYKMWSTAITFWIRLDYPSSNKTKLKKYIGDLKEKLNAPISDYKAEHLDSMPRYD